MTLVSAIRSAALVNTAGITLVHPNNKETYVSYLELYDNALLALGWLQQNDLKPGSELVIQLDDTAAFLYLFWACILGGIAPLPLSPGVQTEQKRKLLNIWPYLSDPYLICDEQQASRLSQTAEEDEGLYDQILQRTLPPFTILPCTTPGKIHPCGPGDLAYIQFSSGSTGQPKGVCLTHNNLLFNIADIITSLGIHEKDKLLSWMPLTHDMGMIGFHLTGVVKNIHAVCIPTSLFIRRPLLWMDKTSSHKASVLYSPNFGLQYLLNGLKSGESYSWDLSYVKVLVNGAEMISLSLCQKFLSSLAPYHLSANCIVPAYGMAEAGVEVAAMPPGDELHYHSLDRRYLAPGDRVKTTESSDAAVFMEVGYPVSGCAVRICDEMNNVRAEHFIGHIQIKGANVTSGYYNNPDATRVLFTEDGWLKTGDLGFFHQGKLVITGRWKNIIIINGRNYYPDDIQQIIMSAGIPDVRQVVACGAIANATGVEQLVIFSLYKGTSVGFRQQARAIGEVIGQKLGIYTDKIIPIGKIPKTTSGKVQHFLLKDQYEKGLFDEQLAAIAQQGTGPLLPGNGKMPQEELAVVIARVLGVSRLDDHTSFFDAGLNSLLATKLINTIHILTGKQLSVDQIFQYHNIALLSDLIAGHQPGLFLPALVHTAPGREADLSHAQRRIWTECQLLENNVAYNIPIVHQVTGQLDIALLEEAFRMLIQKYEILRTAFILKSDAPVQQVVSYSEQLFSLKKVDLRELPEGTEMVETLIGDAVNQVFELGQPCQLDVRWIRVTDDHSVLVWVIHHMLVDGWSLKALFREWQLIYDQLLEGKEILPGGDEVFQFRDYVYWQRQLSGSDLLQAQRAYWIQELKGMPDPVSIIARKTYHHQLRRIRAAHYTLQLDTGELESIQGLSSQYNISEFGIVISLLNLTLLHFTGRRDITIGFDVSGRVTAEMEQLIGYTLNTLCLRTQLDGSLSFAGLLELVREKLLLALKHQHYPFEMLLEEYRMERTVGPSGFFGILVLYQDFQQEALQPGFKYCSCEQQSVFVNESMADIVMEWTTRKTGAVVVVHYNNDQGTESVVSAFMQCFRELLREASSGADKPLDNFSGLSRTLKPQWAQSPGFNIKRLHVPVHQLFEQCVVAYPNGVAVIAGDVSLTYKALNHRANEVAHFLKTHYPIASDTRIGFLTGRTEQVIIAMLGILKTGAAYVALDPELPPARQHEMIAGSGMICLLTDQPHYTSLKERLHDIAVIDLSDREQTVTGDLLNLPFNGRMSDLAYVIYTSGSTGTPKGVMIEHHSLTHYVQHFIHYFEVSREDIFIQQASVAFDTMVEEIFPALCSFSKVVIAPEGGRDVEALLSLIAIHRATILSTTPLVIREINDRDVNLTSLRALISGGDVLHSAYISRLIGKVPIYNSYGPSETTVCATCHRVKEPEDAPLIGRPLGGYEIFIMDEHGKPVQDGIEGEIFIAGGLARGYLDMPEETAEKFVAHPYQAGKKAYRSGDRGKWLPEGLLAFAGRNDHQLKVRGHRAEPAEIESIICRHPDVSMACVILDAAHEFPGAFIVVKNNYREDQLRNFISSYLPYYMIPYRFEVIDRLPLTVSGKVNRRALQEMWQVKDMDTNAEAIAGDTLELRLLLVFKEVLGLRALQVSDNFFEHGCNSIKATVIVGRIRYVLLCDIGIRDIFLYPTVRLLADRVKQLLNTTFDHILPLERPSYDLSLSQERLWIIHQMNPMSFAYNEGRLYEISGPLDETLFRKTFETIVGRHAIFRTAIIQSGDELQQVIHPASTPLNITYLKTDNTTHPYSIAYAHHVQAVKQPFDLSSGRLYRISVMEAAADRFFLSVVMHHIITDDWSSNLIMREFSMIYRAYRHGAEHMLAHPVLQYRDYAHWSRQKDLYDPSGWDKDYWLKMFATGVPVLDMPLDQKRPAIKKHEADTVSCLIDPGMLQQLNAFGHEHQTSLFMVLLSGVYMLLSRYSGQDDLVIGIPVADRMHPELNDMPGFLVNTLPLRFGFSDTDTTLSILQRVKDLCLESFMHQSYPIGQLLNDLTVNRDLSRGPLFDVLVNYSDISDTVLQVGDLQVRKSAMRFCGSKYDLEFYFEHQQDGLVLTIVYDLHLFRKDSIDRMALHYLQLLQSMLQYPLTVVHELSYLTKEESDKVLQGFNDTTVEIPELRILDLIQKATTADPEQVAVNCNGSRLTYRELNERSEKLAGYLQHVGGVRPGDRICLLLERSELVIIAILAVWKAGAVYIPVDVNAPTERIRYILTDTAAGVVITDTANQAYCSSLDDSCERKLIIADNVPGDFKPAGVGETPEDKAYIMYTSGSTGVPKGVEVMHRGVLNVLHYLKQVLRMEEQYHTLSVSSYVFDISVAEFFLPLTAGATLWLATAQEVTSAAGLIALMKIADPVYMQATPGLWNNLIQGGWQGSDTLVAVTCGEELPDNLRILLLERTKQLWNLYGPTETTIFSTGKQILSDREPISIGKPLNNTLVYLLDRYKQPVPVGVNGEIYIGGTGVACGYLRRPDLTARQFIEGLPFYAGRLYATGDIGCWLPDGSIMYKGRKDDQVKIRGYRVETAEIAYILMSLSMVKGVEVIAEKDVDGHHQLIAYVVHDPGEDGITDRLRQLARRYLPEYMIPVDFISVERMWLTANGKIDKQALAAERRRHQQQRAAAIQRSAFTEMENSLIAIWEDILDRKDIGINDSFFDIGGHSLKANRMISRIYLELGIKIRLTDAFQYPTIKVLAAFISQHEQETYDLIELA